MDLAKAERQTHEGDNQQRGAQYFKALLQDFLCFLILIFAALLIGWGIFFVLDDGTTEWKYMQRTHNCSKVPLQETSTEPVRSCCIARQWVVYLFRAGQSQEQSEVPSTEPELHPNDLETKTQVPQVEERPQEKLPKEALHLDTDPATNQVEPLPLRRIMDLLTRPISR